MKHYYTYILSNASRMLYVGVTNDLMRRMSEHRQKLHSGYAVRYNLKQLVHYEMSNDINAAIAREKEIKGWARGRKEALIRSENPEWRDLCKEWFSEGRKWVLGGGRDQDPSPSAQDDTSPVQGDKSPAQDRRHIRGSATPPKSV